MKLLESLLTKLHQKPRFADFLALFAGAISPLALAPFDYWFVGLGAIFLFLMALNEGSLRRNLWRFYLYGAGLLGAGASWLYVSIHEHGQASELLAGTLVLMFVLAVAIPSLGPAYLYLKFFHQRRLAMLAFAALWCSKEWLYTWFLTGFPWLFTGYGHLDTALGSYAPYLGVLGVSFFAVLSVGLLFHGLIVRSSRKEASIAFLAIAVIWLTGFGLSTIELVKAVGPPVTVSLVQGNIDQKTKWRRASIWPILQTYQRLSRDEWGRDLIIWPEASITVFREHAGDILSDLDARAKKAGSSLIMGIPDRDAQGNFLNSAISIGEGSGHYYKRHLVPFGEYMPLEDILRGLIQFFDLPMSHNKPGPQQQPLLLAGDLKLALSICYEIVFPALVRDNPEVPDLLVTISNDTWFGRSAGPLQHMQMARMRALENGRYLVRATNNGVTVVVSHEGQVLARLPQFVADVLRAEVQIMTGITPYTRWGDFPILGLIVLVLIVVGRLANRDTRSDKAAAP